MVESLVVLNALGGGVCGIGAGDKPVQTRIRACELLAQGNN
jgi:hypothetical protein